MIIRTRAEAVQLAELMISNKQVVARYNSTAVNVTGEFHNKNDELYYEVDEWTERTGESAVWFADDAFDLARHLWKHRSHLTYTDNRKDAQ